MISCSFVASATSILANMLIGDFLHVRGVTLFIVFADQLVLQETLQMVNAVAADMAHRNPRLFRIAVGRLSPFPCGAAH